MTNRKPSVTTITYARMTNDRVNGPATGRNRSNIDPKLSWARFARSNMAAISAVVLPTDVADVRWAATPQKTTPITAPPPDEIISAIAFCTSWPGLFRFRSEATNERLVNIRPFHECQPYLPSAISTTYVEGIRDVLPLQ